MKYRIEKLGDDGVWRPYRNGQKFNSPATAHRVYCRIARRYGFDRVRCEPVDVDAATWEEFLAAGGREGLT